MLSSLLGKCKLKQKMTYYYTNLTTAKMKKTDYTKCWQGHKTTETLILYWWEGKIIGQSTLANSSFLSTHWLKAHLVILLLNIYRNIGPYKKLSMNVHSRFICNHQKLEKIQITINRWIEKPTVVCSYNRTLLTNRTTDTQNESQNDQADWRKPDKKEYTLCNSIYENYNQWWQKTGQKSLWDRMRGWKKGTTKVPGKFWEK